MQPSNNGRWMMRLHHKLKLTNQYVAKRLNFNQIYSFSQFFNLVIAVIMRTDVLDSDWLLQMSQNAQYPSKEDVFNCKAEWVCVVSLNMRFVNTSFYKTLYLFFRFKQITRRDQATLASAIGRIKGLIILVHCHLAFYPGLMMKETPEKVVLSNNR